MIDHGCRRRAALPLALHTVGMLTEEPSPSLAPRTAVGTPVAPLGVLSPPLSPLVCHAVAARGDEFGAPGVVARARRSGRHLLAPRRCAERGESAGAGAG
jgi:hypothetical protein